MLEVTKNLLHSYLTCLAIKLVTLTFFRSNQWLQWLHRAYNEEGREAKWKFFVEEMWAQFGSKLYQKSNKLGTTRR